MSPATPPCFVWTTSEDATVAPANSLAFASACAAAGVPFELHVFEKDPHGLSLATKASAREGRHLSADVTRWTELLSTWLQARYPLV